VTSPGSRIVDTEHIARCALLQYSVVCVSSGGEVKREPSRRTVTRGRWIGAEAAARVAGNYAIRDTAVKDSKACVVM